MIGSLRFGSVRLGSAPSSRFDSVGSVGFDRSVLFGSARSVRFGTVRFGQFGLVPFGSVGSLRFSSVRPVRSFRFGSFSRSDTQDGQKVNAFGICYLCMFLLTLPANEKVKLKLRIRPSSGLVRLDRFASVRLAPLGCSVGSVRSLRFGRLSRF